MGEENASQIEFDFEAVFDVDDYLYFYGEILTDELSDRQVNFLIRELDLASPLRILDLACGFGRHANRLAALGHEVTGIDLMPGFLEIARMDAARRGVNVTYMQGDMREIDFQEAFDLVLLLFTAFGYFDDAQNLRVLENVRRALKPGGRLVFDLNNRDVLVKNLFPFFVQDKGGDLMIDRTTFDSRTGRMVNKRIVIRNGKRKDLPYTVRLYNPTEIRTLLGQAGFSNARLYGNWDGEPLTSESRRMIIVADE